MEVYEDMSKNTTFVMRKGPSVIDDERIAFQAQKLQETLDDKWYRFPLTTLERNAVKSTVRDLEYVIDVAKGNPQNEAFVRNLQVCVLRILEKH